VLSATKNVGHRLMFLKFLNSVGHRLIRSALKEFWAPSHMLSAAKKLEICSMELICYKNALLFFFVRNNK
jgi:hypothetical protein